MLLAPSIHADGHDAAGDTGSEATDGVAGETGDGSTSARDIGYFFGFSLGASMRANGVSEVDGEGLIAGIQDAMAGRTSELDADQVRVVTDYIRALRARVVSEANARRAEELEREAEKARQYLQTNAMEPGVLMTPSGLQYIIEHPGEGPRPTADSTVEVAYRGTLTNGTEFDATDPGKTVQFNLRQVISGWSEGVPLIARGGKIRLFVPPRMGYGERGTPNIPPNAVLIFDVTLVDFE